MQAIVAHMNRELSQAAEGHRVFASLRRPFPASGPSGGFTFMLEDRSGGTTSVFCDQNLNKFLAAARKRPELAESHHHVPAQRAAESSSTWIATKSCSRASPSGDVYQTLADFHGRILRQLFQPLRPAMAGVLSRPRASTAAAPDEVGQFYVRTTERRDGSAERADARSKRITGPEFTHALQRVSLRRRSIGSAAPGYSSGQAMKALEEVFAETMPREMGFDYSGMSFQEQQARKGASPLAIFGLSLVFVFLILAALYESWSLPFSVLLGTPMAVVRRVFPRCAVRAHFDKQRLRADRAGDAHRSGREERHSDRRVRQSANMKAASRSPTPRWTARASGCAPF